MWTPSCLLFYFFGLISLSAACSPLQSVLFLLFTVLLDFVFFKVLSKKKNDRKPGYSDIWYSLCQEWSRLKLIPTVIHNAAWEAWSGELQSHQRRQFTLQLSVFLLSVTSSSLKKIQPSFFLSFFSFFPESPTSSVCCHHWSGQQHLL